MGILKKKKTQSAMVVVNTIHNAAVLTRRFLDEPNGYRIYHLSSYLTPKDRVKILYNIKKELVRGTKVILIATSIVECGVDMSFQLGFRQKCNSTSVMQFNGRINRDFEKRTTTTFLFDFSGDSFREGIFTENPMFNVGKRVLNTIPLEEVAPEFCTDIILREMNERPQHPKQEGLRVAEAMKRFKSISEEFKVIDSHTITVIIDPTIQTSIKNGEYVSYRRILKNSVQLWFTKLEDPRFEQYIEQVTEGERDYYFWTGPYDGVYGIGNIL